MNDSGEVGNYQYDRGLTKMDSNIASDLREIEKMMGRKMPESLYRSVIDGKFGDLKPAVTPERSEKSLPSEPHSLHSKIQILKREMAQLQGADVKLMRHLVSIHDGIESTRWALEERGPGLASEASRDSSLAGSLCSLAEDPDASRRSSLSSLQQSGSDSLDAMSVGSYLDTLVEDQTSCHPLTG